MAHEPTTRGLIAERYRLLDTIGRGGMGAVWRASDGLLEREVAVKQVELPVWLPEQEQASLRARVMREARAAARMSHPASVTVFDVIEDHQSTYIVMELIDAVTLTELVEEQGPLVPERAARIGLELLSALEAAHRLGIVHRDVKPSNIMVAPNGSVKLADFGIASVRDHPAITSTGQLVGSPAYMAPEQAQGHTSGPPADLWGLGATLYYAVEGSPPFDREGAIPTLTAVVNENPAEPTRAGPLADVVLRLLAKSPEERPSAAWLRGQLERVAAGPQGDAVAATPVPATVVADPATAVDEPEARATAPEEVPIAESAPTAGEPAAAPARRGGRGLLPLAGLALVAVLLGLLVWRGAAGGERPGADPERATATTGATSTASPRRPPAQGRTAGVPAEWVSYTDPATGYRVSHPPTWRARTLDRTRTDITDPATGSYLRLDWTDEPGPSPKADWEQQSPRFGARHPGYQELRIDATTYKGLPAAEWEYAYSSGGARLHAVDLGFVTPKYGFALNFQTPEERWEASQPTFEAFKASFQVPD